jgi:hypothetical protein
MSVLVACPNFILMSCRLGRLNFGRHIQGEALE